jgi:myo-inositol-1(or 4)-monophosphatase
MDEVPVDRLADVAERAARAGGDYLLEQFRVERIEGEFGPDDVKAVADREAEQRIRSVIEAAFPEHGFHGEEAGRSEGDRYRWLVDPLDGTNNFAHGLPAFATALSVVDEASDDALPVASAIYEPLPDSLYLACRGGGATVNGEPMHASIHRDLAHGTVSFVLGDAAVRDPDLRAESWELQTELRSHCKRVINTWSPTVDWGLLARGDLEGLVEFHPTTFERPAGGLIAAESGVVAHEVGQVYVASPDPDAAATLREVVASV